MPANKFKVKRSATGLGLFTQESLEKNAFVIEYTGEKISHAEADKRCGKYLFTLNSAWVIDGKKHHHLARYINHACRPNCEPRIVGGKIKIYAKKNIPAGTELTYNYGQEYVDEFIKPFGCHCNSCCK